MIELRHITKSYTQGGAIIPVLRDISFQIKDGEKVAIIGASGSGKSTLLALMSGMDTPDSGEILIDGKDIASFTPQELSQFRNTHIAIIFQSFELVPSFSAKENVMLPLDIRKTKSEKAADDALLSVGLLDRSEHLPSMLSGGEEQRVAIARALAQNPKILFADEPTGNLDRKTGTSVLELLLGATEKKERTLVIITHDEAIANMMDRVLQVQDGTVSEITS